MIYQTEEIIWHSNDIVTWQVPHNGYHVTEMKKVDKIIEKGLQSKCGKRSKSVGDKEKAIYFTTNLEGSFDWINMLYPYKSIEDIIVLKFNLQNKEVHLKNICVGDFYIKATQIKPEKIDYLEVVYQDEATSLMNLQKALYKEKDYRLQWRPLLELKK